jgi:hypothetical protein
LGKQTDYGDRAHRGLVAARNNSFNPSPIAWDRDVIVRGYTAAADRVFMVFQGMDLHRSSHVVNRILFSVI